MALETTPGSESKKDPKEVQIFMTRAGDHWYRDPETNAVVEFDDDAEAEKVRQQTDPDSEPAEGFPRFSSHVETMEIPTEGFAKKKEELRMLIDNITDMSDKDRKKYSQQFERATDEKKVDALRKRIDSYLEKRATGSATDTERTEIPQDTAAFENKKRELKDRIEAAYAANKLSANDRQTFGDAIDSARYIQELPAIENDIAQREADSVAPDSPAEPTTPGESTEPPANSDPFSGTNIDDLLKRLSSKTKDERQREIRQNMQQPERARRNRDSHQDLHDLLTGAQDRASEENEGRATEAGTDAGGPPEQPPTDALRQSVGRPPGGGSDGAAKEEPKKNLYKIDQRNYIGLNIMSVQSIIHDPVHQQFFGELIHAIDPNANQIQQRYLNGGATPEDMSLMKYAAYEYSKWNKAWEDLVAHLTDTDVEAFMRRTEMLDNIAAHVGGTRGKEALMTMLRFTAMRDQRTFESIEHAVHEMHAVRDSYLGRLAEDKINGLARRVGINRDNFEDVFDFSTPAAERETHAHLVELFEKKAGRGRRAMDWLSRFSPTPLAGSSQIAADNAIADAKLALSGRFGKTGKKLDRLGATLKHASESLSNVVGTQEVIDQITLETINNERMRMGSEAGPKTFEAAKQQIDRVPQPELEKMITEKIKSDPHWTSGGASYQAAEIQKMKQNATNSLNAGTGFWAWFLRTLFATKFDKATINARRAAGAVH